VIGVALIFITTVATILGTNFYSGALRSFHPALGRPPWINPDGDFDADSLKNRLDPNPFEADIDGDGLSDGFEILQLGTDPLKTNPSVAYAVKKGIDLDLVSGLRILDDDGVMGDNVIEFIDRLAGVSSRLIPEEMTMYYTDEEILDLQTNLILSVLRDGRVSDVEIEVLDRLYDERWYVARDIINSGMLDQDALYENWDGDLKDGKPLNNIEEILQGTNPLDNLEVDPRNLSERYAIIVSRIHFDARYNWYIYHQLRKNGYTDRNIVVSIYCSPGREDDLVVYHVDLERTSSGDWTGARAFYRKNLLRYFPIEADCANMTSREFLNAIENMILDDNDLALIVYQGHGPRPSFVDGEVIEQEMAESMSSLKGRVVYVHCACQADMFLKDPIFARYLSGKEVLFLGAMSAEETGGAAFSFSFLECLVKGYSINRAFESARRYTTENSDEHPTRHYFGKADSWCNSAGFARYSLKSD